MNYWNCDTCKADVYFDSYEAWENATKKGGKYKPFRCEVCNLIEKEHPLIFNFVKTAIQNNVNKMIDQHENSYHYED